MRHWIISAMLEWGQRGAIQNLVLCSFRWNGNRSINLVPRWVRFWNKKTIKPQRLSTMQMLINKSQGLGGTGEQGADYFDLSLFCASSQISPHVPIFQASFCRATYFFWGYASVWTRYGHCHWRFAKNFYSLPSKPRKPSKEQEWLSPT